MPSTHFDMLSRCLAGLLLTYVGAIAQYSVAQDSVVTQQVVRWQDLPAFIDEVVATQLILNDIPGAVVALVSDGKILHLNGYGYADREAQTPVRANATLFGTGSISKLFTCTAVMQLVEQGSLLLDADINQYLTGFRIPATYPQPITLAHLMTHTAGFERRVFGFHARSAGELVPLATFLQRHLPARVFPTGEVSAYSNYGAVLAGRIVERVADIPFEQYIEVHILAPLGMNHSSFRQPLPPALATELATGYRGSDGPSGREWYQAGPAGALKATAADMARFMLAHLQQGRLGTERILDPSSVAVMQRRQFGNHPAVSGLAYGFQELQRGDQRILWHPGDTLFFTAALFLLPKLNLGIYVAYNRGGLPHSLPLELLDALLARVAPRTFWPAQRAADADPGRITRLTGNYRSTRSAFTSLEKVLELFSPVRVEESGPGVLNITGLDVVEDSLWVEQAPYVFKDMASEEILVFREGDEGEATYLFEGNMPVAGYFRLPWHGAPEVHYVLLALCSLIFLASVLGWSVRAWRRRDRARPAHLSVRLARQLAGMLCLTNLVFMAGMLAVLGRLHRLLFGIPPFVRGVLLLPLLSAVLTMLVTVFLVPVWRNSDQHLRGRLHYTLVLLAALGFLWSLHYWCLL